MKGNVKLYQVVGYDGDNHIFCTTPEIYLARKVLKNVREACSKYLRVSIVENMLIVDRSAPKLTWLFFYNEGGIWGIEVVEPEDEFPYENCYIIKAPTLTKAKQILKKKHNVEA